MPDNEIEVMPAYGPDLVAVTHELFLEYADAIGVDLEYQGFAAELAGLPSPYNPPHGAIFVARVGNDAAGCVAVRRLDDHSAEMKRLYVRPGYRQYGLGRRLIEAAILAARQVGYRELKLDTLPSMVSAQNLYRALGFTEIQPYNSSHLPGTRFYALPLVAIPASTAGFK